MGHTLDHLKYNFKYKPGCYVETLFLEQPLKKTAQKNSEGRPT